MENPNNKDMDGNLTPEQEADKQRADECVKEVLAVFKRFDCEPCIEIKLSSHTGTDFRLSAQTITRREEQSDGTK